MILCPVRCYSCGAEVCAKHWKYRNKLRDGMTKGDALDSVGAERVCCRRMLISQPTHYALLGGLGPAADGADEEEQSVVGGEDDAGHIAADTQASSSRQGVTTIAEALPVDEKVRGEKKRPSRGTKQTKATAG